VEVLAVGATTTTVAPPPTDAQTSAAIGTAGAGQTTTTLFTLAVTQEQAERIIHSSRTGALTFALLGPEAHATTGKGVDDRTLFEVTP
jgi:pilus assembly protein CpaB